ncbi:MAG TPA: hypothetical protein VN326_18475 [Casimicrobiaceae bacterium]|nr:hypothetical protein [Casimicrobiaceae bacterium]
MDKVDARRVRDLFQIKPMTGQGGCLRFQRRTDRLPGQPLLDHERRGQQRYEKEAEEGACYPVARHLPA